MNRTELAAIQKRIDNIEKNLGYGTKREIEDITDVLLEIFRYDFLDDLSYGRYEIDKSSKKEKALFSDKVRSMFIKTILKRQCKGDYSRKTLNLFWLYSNCFTPNTTEQEFMEKFTRFMFFYQQTEQMKQEREHPQGQENDTLFDDLDID